MPTFEFPFRQQEQPLASLPVPEAQILTLREIYAAYECHRTECAFSRGDIVTPVPTAPYKNVGNPHIVLEVDDTIPMGAITDGSDSGEGVRPNMRVAAYVDGVSCNCHWVEAFWFQPYEVTNA